MGNRRILREILMDLQSQVIAVSLDIRFSITALRYSLQSIFNHKSLPVSLDIRFSITPLRYSLQSIFNHKSLPVSLDIRFSITPLRYSLQSIFNHKSLPVSLNIRFSLSHHCAILCNRSSITSHCLFLSISIFLSPPLRYSLLQEVRNVRASGELSFALSTIIGINGSDRTF
jgi:hypothetical protein